jgi:DNA helicase HerA-like ATPase
MMRVLEKAIFDVYEKVYRFDPVNKETWKKEDPTLLDVVRYLEGEVKPYLEGRQKRQPPLFRTTMALLERLRRWVEGQGTDFFAHKSNIALSELLKQPIVVFNVKALPEDARDMFTYYIFSYFYALMEMSPPLPTFGLRILLVFDEGWILLKHERGQESPLAPLFRRARKYGFAAIIATQQYKDVSEDILPLVGTVILLRIRDAEAVKKLKDTLKIPDRIANMIPNLPTGKAVISIAWRRTDFQNSNVPFLVNVETAVKPVLTLVFYKRAGPEEVFRALRSQMTRSSE